MFSWFDARESKEFGIALADFFIERLPLEATGKKNKSLVKKKEVLDKGILKVRAFRQGHKLNVYKKAQLGNVFKWRMREAHYDAEFVDELTNIVMTQL
ncbi:MAG: hypothetical protein V4634_15155 [Pseudomonadota bacterium]